MPRFYCDYCDIYLKADSFNGRKQHQNGRKHQDNVRQYYMQYLRRPNLTLNGKIISGKNRAQPLNIPMGKKLIPLGRGIIPRPNINIPNKGLIPVNMPMMGRGMPMMGRGMPRMMNPMMQGRGVYQPAMQRGRGMTMSRGRGMGQGRGMGRGRGMTRGGVHPSRMNSMQMQRPPAQYRPPPMNQQSQLQKQKPNVKYEVGSHANNLNVR